MEWQGCRDDELSHFRRIKPADWQWIRLQDHKNLIWSKKVENEWWRKIQWNGLKPVFFWMSKHRMAVADLWLFLEMCANAFVCISCVHVRRNAADLSGRGWMCFWCCVRLSEDAFTLFKLHANCSASSYHCGIWITCSWLVSFYFLHALMQNIYPYSDLTNIILDFDDRYQCKDPVIKQLAPLILQYSMLNMKLNYCICSTTHSE